MGGLLRIPVASGASATLAALALLAPMATASGAPGPDRTRQKPPAGHGTLTQLAGGRGCLVDRSAPAGACSTARALKGPGPFMGSRAIALSPNGRNVYVAASRSDAIAIFRRDPRSGRLAQSRGARGCVAAGGAGGCASAIGLDGANSVAVSPDGRSVYATARAGDAVTAFRRDRRTGALTQLRAGAGCVSGLGLPGCATGRALSGPDVVVLSPDGANVYVGSFFGNAVAVLARDRASGAISQPAGAAGCIAEDTASGCAPGIALAAPEGLAVSRGGAWVYVASALSGAVAVLARDPAGGALTQSLDGSGCVADAPLEGCVTGVQLDGANAVAVSPRGGDVYATSLFSNSVSSFGRSSSPAGLAQKPGTSACLVWLRAVGCSFGRALRAPEGLAISPDGRNVYAAAFASGAIAVLDRARRSGAVTQKPGRAGCLAVRSVPGCTGARALRGVSSLALSPDGRHLYSTSFGSDAVDVFRRSQ